MKLSQALSNTSITANHTNTDTYFDNSWDFFEIFNERQEINWLNPIMYSTHIANMPQTYQH